MHEMKPHVRSVDRIAGTCYSYPARVRSSGPGRLKNGGTACVELLLQLFAFGLSNGAVIALNALGVTLVYSVVRTVNFAYGDLFALSTVLVATLVGALGLRAGGPAAATTGGLLLALGGAMLFGALLNVGVERLAFRPFRGRSRLAPLVAGIGLSFILFQVALIWRVIQDVGWGNPEHHSDVDNLANVSHANVPDLLPRVNLVRALGLPLQIVFTLKDLLVLVLAVALASGTAWLLQRTRLGRMVRACAQDFEQAQLCGVDPDRAIRLVFALGGALAGAGAFVYALYYGHPFGQHGAQSGLVAFTAAVLGGIGNPFGALLSGIFLGVLSSFSDYFLPPRWTPVLVLATLILLLVLRPTGLVAEGEGGEQDERGDHLVERRRTHRADRSRSAIFFAVALLYPLLDRALGLHVQAIAVNILIFALLALGLNIVMGFAGLLDLGFAACFAIGGYTAGLLTTAGGAAHPLEFAVVLGASMAVAGLFGALNGALTLRLRGDYLAIVALAFGQMAPKIVVNLGSWTGAKGGLAAIPAPRLLSYPLLGMVERYYLTLVLLVLVAVVCLRLSFSRLGRAWAALRDDELAAVSCGVNLAWAKPLAFILGASVAGVAAALSATIFGYVDPEQSDFLVSALVLAMVVIGGAGSVPGVMLGAVIVGAYNQLLLPWLGGGWDRLAELTGARWMGVVRLSTLSYFSFGLALYLTVLIRARRGAPPADPELPHQGKRSAGIGGLGRLRDRVAGRKGL